MPVVNVPDPSKSCCVCHAAIAPQRRLCSSACTARASDEIQRLTRARGRLIELHRAWRPRGVLDRLVRPVMTWRQWQARRDLAAVGDRLEELRAVLARHGATVPEPADRPVKVA